VDQWIDTVATAVVGFVGTNIDDLVLLGLLFFAANSTDRWKPRQIVIGQYLGLGVLVAVSILCAAGLATLKNYWVGLLGFIPLGIGTAKLIRLGVNRKSDDEELTPAGAGIIAVAAVTVSNGADNISVYVPLFRGLDWAGMVVTIIVFALMLAVWCLAGRWLGFHPRAEGLAQRLGRWAVPVVFVVLGITILVSSGAARRLWQLSQ
jgi:cadmium resistance protein CadD (predicted permease)